MLAFLLLSAVTTAAAINWEDAACLAVTGNTTASVDGPPEQIHMTFGKNETGYVVNWVSALTFKDFAGFGSDANPNNNWVRLSPGNHGQTYRPCLVQSHAEWGTSTDPAGSGWLRASSAARLCTEPMCGSSRLMHSVIMYDVAPGVPLYYRVRSYGGQWSAVRRFQPAPRPGAHALTAVFTFDMASRNSGTPADMVCETNITAVPMLVAAAEAGEFDVGFHGGDTSYNLDDNCGRTGDDFMNDMAGAVDARPYVFMNGNHETSYDRTYDVSAHRFQGQMEMAYGSWSGSTRYFSKNVGPVHFVVLDGDAWTYYRVYGLAGAQYLWLEHDLASVNRTATPWVVVLSHRPMYNAWPISNEDDATRNGIRADALHEPHDVWQLELPRVPDVGRLWAVEPLLLKYGVDLWLAGHVHSYHRTWPVAGGMATQRDFVEPKAPIHILDGVGGCSGLSAARETPPWMAYRDPTRPNKAAYGELQVHNATHATWRSRHAVDRATIDQFTIVQHDHGPFAPPDAAMTRAERRE